MKIYSCINVVMKIKYLLLGPGKMGRKEWPITVCVLQNYSRYIQRLVDYLVGKKENCFEGIPQYISLSKPDVY